MLVVGILICSALEYYFASIPRQYHAINSRVVWMIVTMVVIQIAAGFLIVIAPPLAIGISLFATVLMFVFRALAYVGLAVSFARCGRDLGIRFSPAGTVMAWVASLFDALIVMGILAAEVVNGLLSGGLSQREQGHYTLTIYATLGVNLVLTIWFLTLMGGNRKKLGDFQRQERKRKTDEKNRTRAAAAAENKLRGTNFRTD
jgi:hypothetical protein